MNDNQTNRKLLTGALIGTIAGVTVVMFDKKVRRKVIEKSKHYGKQTLRWADGVRNDPQAFINNVKSSLDQVTRSFKEVSSQVQDIVEQIDDVRDTSAKMLQTAKDASEEMKEVGSSLIHVHSTNSESEYERYYERRRREDLQKLH